MDIQLLENFLVVCEERNLSRAAVRLFRTQSAVSRQVQALEAELGFPLLERTPKGVRPTAQGEELRERGARILGELRSLREIGAEGPGGELVLACSDTAASHFLAPVLGRFARAFPRVKLRIEGGVTPSIANLVERGACELGLVLLPLRNPRLELNPVLRYHHIAVFPKGLVPAGSEINVAELCGRPLVLLSRDSATRRAFDESVAAKGLHPTRVLEVGSVSVQKALIRAGLGAGLLPDYALEPRDGLASLPIKGSKEKVLALCRLKAKAPSPAAARLMEMLEA